jgi:hypothetical protein
MSSPRKKMSLTHPDTNNTLYHKYSKKAEEIEETKRENSL